MPRKTIASKAGKDEEGCEHENANSSDGFPARGLTNLGNTCFFNSVMQNLIRTRVFREKMMSMEDDEDLEDCGGLRECMSAFVAEMVRPAQSTRKSDSVGTYKPSALLAEIIKKAPRYAGGHQHDAHELLWTVLDRLLMEERARIKEQREGQESTDKNQNGGDESKPPKKEAEKKTEQAHKRIVTYIDEIFGGNLRGTIVCKRCGRESVNYEPFVDLSLPIPERFRGEGRAAAKSDKKDTGSSSAKAGKAPVEEEEMSKRQRKELMKQKAKQKGTAADSEGRACMHVQKKAIVYEVACYVHLSGGK
jgi:ubiquitin C-terminal hydrolase